MIYGYTELSLGENITAELGIRRKAPPDVCGFVQHEILAHLELTVTDVAIALGITRPALSGLLNEYMDPSPEMVLPIEMTFGDSFDLTHARHLYDDQYHVKIIQV